MRRQTATRPHGLTLTECLVGLALLGMLAAIALPALHPAPPSRLFGLTAIDPLGFHWRSAGRNHRLEETGLLLDAPVWLPTLQWSAVLILWAGDALAYTPYPLYRLSLVADGDVVLKNLSSLVSAHLSGPTHKTAFPLLGSPELENHRCQSKSTENPASLCWK